MAENDVPVQDLDSIKKAQAEIEHLMKDENSVPVIVPAVKAVEEAKPKEPELPDAILREYTRCVLGGKRFEHTFPVLNGQVMLTFKELDMDASDGYNAIASRIAYVEDRLYQDKLGVILMLDKIISKGELGVYTGTGVVPEELTKLAGEELKAAINLKYKELFKNYNESFQRIMHRAFFQFLRLLTLLTANQIPENF